MYNGTDLTTGFHSNWNNHIHNDNNLKRWQEFMRDNVRPVPVCATHHMSWPTNCGCRVMRVIPVSHRCIVGFSTAAICGLDERSWVVRSSVIMRKWLIWDYIMEVKCRYNSRATWEVAKHESKTIDWWYLDPFYLLAIRLQIIKIILQLHSNILMII